MVAAEATSKFGLMLKTSCKDWGNAGTTSSGEYLIDVDGPTGPLKPFKVYCSFSYQNMSWTLVTSWRMDKNSMVQKKPFHSNTPINEDDPSKRNDVYRLSLARMQQLRSQSSKWFAACNMNENPTLDSVRASFS